MVSQAFKLALAPVIWRVYCATLSVPSCAESAADGPPAGPLIFACLHRDILPAIIHVRPAHPSLLVSHSPDGDILIRTLGRRAYGFVRGATGENGQRAFVALRRELDAGRSIGLAVDGPKGPYGVINGGVLQLSRLGGATIVPLKVIAPQGFVLGTWDRTIVPRPFGKVDIVRGPQLRVSRAGGESELAAARQQLASFLGVERENRADS